MAKFDVSPYGSWPSMYYSTRKGTYISAQEKGLAALYVLTSASLTCFKPFYI